MFWVIIWLITEFFVGRNVWNTHMAESDEVAEDGSTVFYITKSGMILILTNIAYTAFMFYMFGKSMGMVFFY